MNFEFELTDDDLQYLINLADAAGQAIMEIYSRRNSFPQIVKSDQSPLTAADLASNEIILKGLLLRWPHIPILSEESKNTFKSGERPLIYWAVDPLDGTKEFIKGNDEFTVNIALVVKGEPLVGVVGVPALKLQYLGCSIKSNGLGVFARKRNINGWTDIAVSNFLLDQTQHGEKTVRVAMSRSHPSAELSEWIAQISKVEAIDVGSSLKFCLLAEGRVDIYPRFGLTSIWDTAAGHAIVNAAGGRVMQLGGDVLNYSEPANTLNPLFIAYGNKQ